MSIMNDYLTASNNVVTPEVGMGCTICYWSDRRAATVTRIVSPCKIEVMHNKVECLDYYAGKYDILPEIDENMGVDVFTKRKNGMWVLLGDKLKDGVKLSFKRQRHYIDPHF